MATYLTPGVYRTPRAEPLPAFVLVRTDIAGFVGFAERGPLPEDCRPDTFDAAHVALKIRSWKEFQTKFGGVRPYGYLAYAVRAFFENGGDTCYVVRVAATTAPEAAQQPSRATFTLPSSASALVGTIGPNVAGFTSDFQAATGGTLAPGDLVRIDGNGISQLNHVADLAHSRILWAVKIDPSIQSGATVTRFAPAFSVCAASRGNWGNAIRIRITPLDASTFALRVTVDTGPNSVFAEDEFYRCLTLADKTSATYAPTVLAQQSNLVRIVVPLGAQPLDLGVTPQLTAGQLYLQGGRDGLSAVTLRDFTGGPGDLRGLRLLEEIEDVGILAVPDAVYQGVAEPLPPAQQVDPCRPTPAVMSDPVADDPTAKPTPLALSDQQRVQLRMIDQCERLRYRVALIEPPDNTSIAQMQRWASDQGLVTRASRFAALYYPWLQVPDAFATGRFSRRVPPSGHVAGAYARLDLSEGVQRPPANVELQFVDDVGQSISDVQQGGLNENHVNAIRTFPGRGIRIWGARSLAPTADADWRFIHVRRLMSAIEETVERSSRWAVFQNNDDALRSSLKHSLTVLLEGLWSKGGLKGAKPEDAFYVKCDRANNPQNVVDRGQVVCEVGVAIAAPMEFIVFEIRQDPSGVQVAEV
jgi:uncharacterized protein